MFSAEEIEDELIIVKAKLITERDDAAAEGDHRTAYEKNVAIGTIISLFHRFQVIG